ncbi:unnamed protein product [Echinostoma caproni]|uniref:Lymphocyte expansion molecule n=1 Tax=Echinostoma caproni TaxID=27848 RepID=A0A183B072_9TREM|nr:unnamed protein product [Echinostoma caproni]
MTAVNVAPFGTKSDRFDQNLVHPRWRIEPASPSIGPTTYAGPLDSFGLKLTGVHLSDWKRKYELERQSEIPKLLCRKQFIELEEKKRALGPGTYNINEDSYRKRSVTRRGPIDTGAPRFYEERQNDVPGVGTYGLGGDPYVFKELADHAHKSACILGLLNNGGSGDRALPFTVVPLFSDFLIRFSLLLKSSHLGPGTYNLRDSLDTLLNKRVSNRGPYDLTTGPRSKPINCDSTEPGMYEVQSFVNDLNKPEKRYFGKFRRLPDPMARNRVRYSTLLSARSAPVHEVSPASYDPVKPAKKAPSGNRKNVPFFCSAPRSTMVCNKTPVGPGRYDVELYDDSRCIWGAMCAFDSQTARMAGKSVQAMRYEQKMWLDISECLGHSFFAFLMWHLAGNKNN